MPAARFKIRTHALAYVGLAALFLISLTQWVRDTRDRVDEILHGEQYVRPPFDLDPATLAAGDLDPAAKAAGLRSGDIVLSVEGRPLAGFSDYQGLIRRARLGDRLHVHVRSATAAGPVEKDVSIELQPFTYSWVHKA